MSVERHLCSYLLPPADQELSLCWKCFLKYTDSLRVADVSAMSKMAVNRKQTKGRGFNMQQVKLTTAHMPLKKDPSVLNTVMNSICS